MTLNFAVPLEDLDPNSRFETKYSIRMVDYYAFKNALGPYFKPDHYTQIAPNKRYLVRSLYFDTRDYRMYTEKMDGDCNRIKFRIRTYGTDPNKNPDIRFEMKVRKGNLMQKFGSFVTHQQYQRFLDHGFLSTSEDAVLMEFGRFVKRLNLAPKMLVQYEREGFHSRRLEGIRLTFDHRIISAFSKQLFPEHIFWQRHHHTQIVLEIKHQNNLPNWLNKLIHAYQLKVVPNSKYTNSVEIASKEINLA
jgi:SPX domain protein involved in polyphosphate accumulation